MKWRKWRIEEMKRFSSISKNLVNKFINHSVLTDDESNYENKKILSKSLWESLNNSSAYKAQKWEKKIPQITDFYPST